MDGMSKPHGHSVDDYLEAIHLLVSPIGVYEPAKAPAAIAARVADALGVSRTAVGEMVKRLTADGLLERTRAAGYRFLSTGGRPIQRPFGRFVFLLDADNLLVEYAEPAAGR